MMLAVLAGYLLAVIAFFFFNKSPKLIGYGSAVVVLGIFMYFLNYLPSVSEGESYHFFYAWVPSASVNVSFYLDSLSLFFTLLITFFGAIILCYSTVYMQGKHQVNRFFGYLLVFMASMVGLVLAENVILLYIFWELTSLSSYLLISYENHTKKAREAALQALLVTNVGGLALLAGLILLAQTAGSYEVTAILQASVTEHIYYAPMLLLILLGSFTKSAQFPFHFWLPNAMTAPTPVSAYLHSATMVKAGIYLLFRLHPVLGDHPLWIYTLMGVGGVTMCLGAVLSFVQTDIKKMLAYITVSALGMLVAMIGIHSEAALQAAVVYLLVHAFYKGALFMIAGNIDHETGTRDIRKLSGLFRAMPFTGTAAILSCLAMAGIPPFLGFIGKEQLYESALHAEHLPYIILAAIMFSSMIYVAAGIWLAYGMFFGKSNTHLTKKPHEAHLPMWAGPLLLSILGLVAGFFAGPVGHILLEQAASITIGSEAKLELALWHGFNLIVVLSIITVVAGFLIYYFRDAIITALAFLRNTYPLTPENLYHTGISNLSPLAAVITGKIQSGNIIRYLFHIFFFLIVLLAYVYFKNSLLPQKWQFNDEIILERTYEFIPAIMSAIGIVAIFRARSRLTMLVSLSMIGFGIALIYLLFNAPDVSMTQFLVETLTLVIFMLILHRLPTHTLMTNEKRRVIHIVIALLFGTMITLILFSIQGIDMVSHFKEYYVSNSLSKGKGGNVVNVILVDFRAFDTLGEISVLCVTALGIVALNKLNLQKREKQ